MAASFVARRLFSSSAALRGHFSLQHTLAVPAPTHLEAVLSTPELKSLQTKAAGSWKQLSKEEVVQLYRATFPLSFKEIKNINKGDGWKVLFGVVVGVTFGVFLSNFLSRTIGPQPPHTFKNKEWEEETRKRLLKQKANPIEGISSRS